ncbi:hypothetical protein N7452_003685 [Penicillium brevicompactum]|uniref:AB hydrolase-1 domain-containing protein n=1 Tax=Penicillium brevicompactum TaxID=5074 RepID=A0A9W9QU12_PENBR|nr:hypothetical protein N7452_003685 [Penicillium brevicompactum]
MWIIFSIFFLFLALLLQSDTALSAASPFSSCDPACQKQYRALLVAEAASWVTLDINTDPFYDNPANLSSYHAGDVVKWQDLSSTEVTAMWDVPGGMSLSRIFYVSEDIHGNPIPATGYVLFPYSSPIGGSRPLRTVVFTHGTAGGTGQCAPSNHKTLYYSWSGPFALAQQGYLVIAPDWAGQGSHTPQGFTYEAGRLHAKDVGFAIQATRKELGPLITHEWVVAGHSEGGLAAWRAAEYEATENATGGLIGAVSMAPALRPLTLMEQYIRVGQKNSGAGAIAVYLLQSISRLFPSQLKVEDYLSDVGMARLPLLNSGCLDSGGTLVADIGTTAWFKNTSWLTHEVTRDWNDRFNWVGPRALAAPMLVVQGDQDILVFANMTDLDFNKTCEAFPTSKIELTVYPGADHDTVTTAAQPDWLRWIAARFDNSAVGEGCVRRTVRAVNDRMSNTVV